MTELILHPIGRFFARIADSSILLWQADGTI
jgi:hypothetical protein